MRENCYEKQPSCNKKVDAKLCKVGECSKKIRMNVQINNGHDMFDEV